MEIIRLIYWIGIAANKCVAKVVSLVRRVIHSEQKEEVKIPEQPLSVPAAVKVLAIIENPEAKFRFETRKKGGFRVRFIEIKK